MGRSGAVVVTGLPETPSPTATVPDFETIDAHEDLLAWSHAYADRVVAATDMAVDLSRVDWDVSTRAKRRAAAVFHPRLDGTALGEPIDWEQRDDLPDAAAASEAGAGRGVAADGSPATGPPTCTVRVTWDAAASYDRTTWAETLRHELVHVEQFQQYGTTGHGPQFEARAADLETTVRCTRFATPKYVLTCPACETVVARRYRDCKLVRRHESYRSTCCEEPLSLTRTGERD